MNRDELKQRLIELLIQPICKPCIECKYFEKETGRPNEYCMAENRADHLLANGVTIRERGEWIPVTERLPENDYEKHWKKRNRYLVYTEPQGMMYTAKYGYKNFLWWVDSHDCVMGVDNYKKVTHWMPLPKPPETEKGGAE